MYMNLWLATANNIELAYNFGILLHIINKYDDIRHGDVILSLTVL